jgi:hypothetical protein
MPQKLSYVNLPYNHVSQTIGYGMIPSLPLGYKHRTDSTTYQKCAVIFHLNARGLVLPSTLLRVGLCSLQVCQGIGAFWRSGELDTCLPPHEVRSVT